MTDDKIIQYCYNKLKVESKIKLGIIDNHEVEKYYGDLSELSKHLSYSRTKKSSNNI